MELKCFEAPVPDRQGRGRHVARSSTDGVEPVDKRTQKGFFRIFGEVRCLTS